MRRPVLFAALAFALPNGALADNLTVEAVAGRFCTFMVDGTIDPLTLVTPDLGEAIANALAHNAQIQAAAPDEKPPLGDGIPWASWPDKPDTCDIEVTEAHDGVARVNVTYGFTAAPDANYTDTLVLVEAHPGWAIDDVAFVGNQTLRGLIASAFDP